MASKDDYIPVRQVSRTLGQKRPDDLPAYDSKTMDERCWGEDGLTLKQRLFCRFYVNESGGNAVDAMRRAGYKGGAGCLAANAGANLLKNPNVQRALEREVGRRFGSVEDVKNGLAAIANGTAASFLEPDEEGNMTVSLKKMMEMGELGLIKKLSIDLIRNKNKKVIGKRVKVELYSKLEAQKTLAKIHGLFIEQQQNTTNNFIVQSDPRAVVQALQRDPKAYELAKSLNRQLTLEGPDGETDGQNRG